MCLWAMLVRLVTGCSWVDAERLVGGVSDTTLRARRDEWVDAGVFDAVRAEAFAAYDRVIGLDLSEVALDGSLHKAPCGGEGTGKSPVDRGKLGWKWSVATDANGIPIGWAIDGANRNDVKLLAPPSTTSRPEDCSWIETLHLDRGYDYAKIRCELAGLGLDDVVIQRRGTKGKRPPSASSRSGGAGSSRERTLVLELRPDASQHRPTDAPPSRPALLRDRALDHGQAHRLAQPLEPGSAPIR